MLKLELGKYYKDRSGKVWGPLEAGPVLDWGIPIRPFTAGGKAYLHNGKCISRDEDLVEEWQLEPPAKSSPIPTKTPWYPDDSGDWIEHNGTGCPVSPDTQVHILLAHERERKFLPGTTAAKSAENWGGYWFAGGVNSIVAYRLAKPKPSPQTAPKPAPTTTASSGRVARYFVISREGVAYCYTSLRAAQKAARGFALAAPGRPYTIAVFAETISSKVR